MENKKLEEIDKSLKRKRISRLTGRLKPIKKRTILYYSFITLLVLVLVVFFLRVFLWEKAYYEEKEGSKRVAPTYTETLVLDETEPENVEDYTVPLSHPRYLSIEKLGIKNARILQVGLRSNSELDTPTNIFDVGWYNKSSIPGIGGTIVIDGHNGGPTKTGVFKNLPKLKKGDLITIERGDGEIFTYSVVDNETIPLDEANAYMQNAFKSPEKGKESVTLITCTGEWSNVRQTYLSRQFTRAVLVEENT